MIACKTSRLVLFSPTAVYGLIFGSILTFIFPLPLFILLLLCFFFYTRDFWHLARELEEEDRRRNERKNEVYFTYGQTTKGESGFYTLFV